MRQELERRQAKLVKKIAALARSRRAVGTNGSIGRFVGLYYEHVPPRDMVEQVPENLLGAALSHWTLAGRRKPGEAKVRVYNPSPGTDGWTAEHTVVEIVTDDMPFLVDSVTAALHREDVRVHLVIHPMVRVRRAKTGRLSGLAAAGEGTNESFMHVEITAQSGDRLDAIRATVERVVGDVRAAVEDWPTMRRRLQAIIDEVASRRRRTSAADLAEALDFLQWIHDDQFTFLGYRDYDVKTVRGRTKVVVDAKTGLGILRDPKVSVFRELRILGDMPTEVRAFAARPDILMVTKANLLSTVHRRCTWTPSASRSWTPRAASSANACSSGSLRQAPTTAARARSRFSGARSRRPSTAPASRRRATTPRPCSTSWRPSRATNCSRCRTITST